MPPSDRLDTGSDSLPENRLIPSGPASSALLILFALLLAVPILANSVEPSQEPVAGATQGKAAEHPSRASQSSASQSSASQPSASQPSASQPSASQSSASQAAASQSSASQAAASQSREQGHADEGTPAGTDATGAEAANDNAPDFDVAALAGHWEGQIRIPGQPLAVQIDLEASTEGLSGTADIPPQGLRGLPLLDARAEADGLTFSIGKLPGKPTFEGALEADGTIRGEFSQGSARFPFVLEKKGEALAEVPRPQTPEPPFPYSAEEVSYGHGRGDGEVLLAATLTLPEGEGPFPAVVLVTGSGLQDRDSTIFDHKPFWVLADHLSRAGIAVLRADDRGVGGSKGRLVGTTASDLADDALAGIRYLKDRGEVDPARLGLIGHSEGGLVAPMAAARSDDVAFVVMLAGLGVPGIEVLPAQAARIAEANGAPAMAASLQAAAIRRQLDIVVTAESSEEAFERLEAFSKQQLMAAKGGQPLEESELESIRDQVRRYSSPAFRHFLSYDPTEALTRLKIPVLVLNGSLDTQVLPEQNLPPIEEALEKAGNPDVTLRELEGLNHLFQHAETGSPAEYALIEETLAPEVLELVTSWILERFGEQALEEAA
ncbi:MAG: alpha/beta fold hydrolase [Holophagales bacterium]|nr:alpha/beta fold hydrolase [Holophagales bacterium]